MTADRIPGDVLDEAAAWAVRLQSNKACDADRRAWAAWRAARDDHEQAWQQLEAIDQLFRSVPAGSTQVAHRTLQAPAGGGTSPRRRRHLLKTLGITTALVAGLAATRMAWQDRAFHATAIGIRRQLTLSDGTALVLNTATRVRIDLSPFARLLTLSEGEIAITTGADREALLGRRPFRVQTPHALLEALGTRFNVRVTAEETRLHVSEGTVAVQTPQARTVLIRPGEAMHISDLRGLERPRQQSIDPAAWVDGRLIARNLRLTDFATELMRYRDAPVVCATDVQGMRVSGVFHLDGDDPAVLATAMLARTLPVRIVRSPDGTLTIEKR